MTELFLDVMHDLLAQPFEARRQASANRHHQRHGLTHVVIRLRQKGNVLLTRDLAAQRTSDDRRIDEMIAIRCGSLCEQFMEWHDRGALLCKATR